MEVSLSREQVQLDLLRSLLNLLLGTKFDHFFTTNEEGSSKILF